MPVVDDIVWNTSESFVGVDELLAATCACDFDPDDTAVQADATAAVTEASSILYVLSGRTIGGARGDTIVPQPLGPCNCRPPWTGSAGSPCAASTIVLETPVREVSAVTLDDVVLDPESGEWAVLDYRYLVRLKDSEGQSRHWTAQVVDTANPRLTVTYTWGLPTPPWVGHAALELACNLLALKRGRETALKGLSSLSIGGASYSTRQAADATAQSLNQLPEVAKFMSLVNPTGAIGAPVVWSPDVPVGGRIVTG